MQEINIHKYITKYNRATYYLLPGILLSGSMLELHILQKIGFINCFLEDDVYTDNYEGCLLLVFQPNKESYEGEVWEAFLNVVKKRDNLVNIVEYSKENRIVGFWFKINDKFGSKLPYNFKKGYYSNFPDNYLKFLPLKMKMVCTKDPKYVEELAYNLGINEEMLSGMELDDIPTEYDYIFKYKEIEEKCKLQNQIC